MPSRIQVRLADDVMELLAKHGRSGELVDIEFLHANPDYAKRPTRTEIIEQAVRIWAEAKAGAGIRGEYMKPPDASPGSRTHEPTDELVCSVCKLPIDFACASEYSPTIHAECQPFPAERKNRSTKEKATARAGRKAELAESVKTSRGLLGVREVDGISVKRVGVQPVERVII